MSDAHRKVGRPTLTWVKLIQKNLANTYLNIDKSTALEVINELMKLTEDRMIWRGLIRDIVVVDY